MAASPLLRVSGLRKGYGGLPVLRGVDFELDAGEGLVVLGPNGAGKSTLLRSLAGLHRPSQGRIEMEGRPFVAASAAQRARLGFVSHDSMVYAGLSAWENLTLVARLYALPDAETRIRNVLAAVDLEWAGRRPVRTFSRGMTQRLTLARALLPNPPLLLLDEPMSGLDPTAMRSLELYLVELRRAGTALLWTTHDLWHLAPVATRVLFLRRGEVHEEASLDPADRVAVEAAYVRLFGAAGARGIVA